MLPGCVLPSFTIKPAYYGVPDTITEPGPGVATIRGMGDVVKNPNNLLETWGSVDIFDIDGKPVAKGINRAYLSPGEHSFRIRCFSSQPVQTEKVYFTEFKYDLKSGVTYYPAYEVTSYYAKGGQHYGSCTAKLQTYRMQK